MAFVSRFSNMLKPWASISKHVRIGLSSSHSPLFQSTRSMASARLFIGGLDYAIDEMGLREAFHKYGQLVDVRVVSDRDSGRSRGFGFVTYTSPNAASSALWDMDGKELCGRRIEVSVAHRPRPRPHRSFGEVIFGDDGSYWVHESDRPGVYEQYFGKNSAFVLYGSDPFKELKKMRSKFQG